MNDILKKGTPDHVYVNARITKDSNDGKTLRPCVFSATKNNPIVNKGSDYYLSVVSADIPGYNLPLYIPNIIPDPLDPTNINNTSYKMGFINNFTNTEYPFNLQFLPTNNASNKQIQDPSNLGASEYYYGVSYSSMLQSMNTAIEQSYADIGIFGAPVPFLKMNDVEQRIELIISNTLRTSLIGTGNIDNPEYSLGYNYDLDSYLNAFNVFYDVTTGNDIAIKFILYNQGNICNALGGEKGIPGGTFFYYKQEFYSLNTWDPVKNIFIYTNSIPIKNSSVTQPGGSVDVQLSDNSPILLSFVPTTRTATQYNTIIYYRSDTIPNLVDIQSDTEIYKIDLRAYWMDYNGKLYNIYISKEQTASIKLCFYKKSLFKNS